MGDDHLLRQVMANVVTNALIHTPTARALAVTAHETDDQVTITVSDFGPGMPPDVVDNAAEWFYRAHRSGSRVRGGAGLGLAIVQAVVEGHQGTLDIVRDVEGGTTVTIVLPRRADLNYDATRTINPETSNPGPNLPDHTGSVDQFACSFSGR